ncbi:MAG: WXG100 family type VII secretion target [Geodermatophilaceae bacterium]
MDMVYRQTGEPQSQPGRHNRTGHNRTGKERDPPLWRKRRRLVEVWTLPEGSGVSRQQLTTFASKADNAAQSMTGAVNTLDNNLQNLALQSKGSFAAMFAQVKMQMQDELAVMNQALTATANDANTAAAQFTVADEDQSQQVNSAGQSVVGLSTGLPV